MLSCHPRIFLYNHHGNCLCLSPALYLLLYESHVFLLFYFIFSLSHFGGTFGVIASWKRRVGYNFFGTICKSQYVLISHRVLKAGA